MGKLDEKKAREFSNRMANMLNDFADDCERCAGEEMVRIKEDKNEE